MENRLLKALESADEAERIYAVQDIVETRNPDLVKPLIRRLAGEASTAVRDSILFCLKEFDCSKSYPLLFNFFTDSDAYLRNAAVTVFGAQGEDAVAFLTSQLGHSDREVRKLLLDALFQVGTPEAVLAIRAGLHDTAVNVQITAVEYLGELGDRDSVGEMVDLLQKTSEPMLRTAIMESLPRLADEKDIQRVLLQIDPDGDLTAIDPVYLPEVIRLVAKAGDIDAVGRVIDAVDENVYAEDILWAVGQGKRRFADILKKGRILEKVLGIALNERILHEIRHAACETLLVESVLTEEQLEEIGLKLTDDAEMVSTGVRFLVRSGLSRGMEKIKTVSATTRDDTLRRFCDELLGQNDEVQ